jgi:protein-S-isoprenylcysteine O-methyltransferase Ste14
MTTIERRLPQEVRAGITKRIVQITLMVAFQAVILFLVSGHLDWLWAWAFLGLYLFGIVINATFMFRYNPETIAQRASAEGMKDWDKIVSGLWAVTGVILLVVAGLDERNGWSAPFPLSSHIIGIAVFAFGFALFSWAMVSNAYFATVVRVQKEHTVCTTGPYHFVRHPGYVGAILQSLALPLFLGSVWALIPGAIHALLMVLRTALEDRTLREELPGYAEYAQRVRFRLLHNVW